MARARKSAELARLRSRAQELRDDEREVSTQRQRAEGDLDAAREALIADLEAERDDTGARKALAVAQEAAGQPWPEIAEARRRRTIRAERDVEDFLRANLDLLVGELEPAARDAQRRLSEALQAVPGAVEAWMGVARTWEGMVKPVQGPATRHPEHHLDQIVLAVRRLFDEDGQGVVAPVPTLNPAPDPVLKSAG